MQEKLNNYRPIFRKKKEEKKIDKYKKCKISSSGSSPYTGVKSGRLKRQRKRDWKPLNCGATED